MWRFDVAGTELYDARARMWSPALGSFLSVDEFRFHDQKGTLWSWPRQNPVRYRDPSGRWGDDSPSTSRWGDYAVTHLDDPGMQALGVGGALVDGGLAAPVVDRSREGSTSRPR
jgi:RHS repeat-associated protein